MILKLMVLLLRRVSLYIQGRRPGDSKWKDNSKDGKITSDDYVVAGSYQPKFEWGFTNTFKYKNLDAPFCSKDVLGGKLLCYRFTGME